MLLERKAIGTVGYLGGLWSVPEPFLWSWTQMLEYTREVVCSEGQYIKPAHALNSYHDLARNELLGKIEGDWLMMFDVDLVFDPDCVARMLRWMHLYDLDVLVGAYPYKSAPHYPILYCWNDDLQGFEVIGSWDKSMDLIEIGSAGGGTLLVRKRVFDRIARELKEKPFDRIPLRKDDPGGGTFGEDHSFFMRCRRLGIKSYCAWKVQAGHLRYEPVSLASHFRGVHEVHHSYQLSGFKAAGREAEPISK